MRTHRQWKVKAMKKIKVMKLRN